MKFDPNHERHSRSTFYLSLSVCLSDRFHTSESRNGATEMLERESFEMGNSLTRWQCLITAATSSRTRSFFAMSSTCCRVSGRARWLPSLIPARDSLGEERRWKGRPCSLSKVSKENRRRRIGSSIGFSLPWGNFQSARETKHYFLCFTMQCILLKRHHK